MRRSMRLRTGFLTGARTVNRLWLEMGRALPLAGSKEVSSEPGAKPFLDDLLLGALMSGT